MKYVSFLWMAVVFFLIAGCGKKFTGTDTGNPFTEDDHSSADPSIEGQEDVSKQIASALCSRLVACDPGTQMDTCISGVMRAPGVAPELGFTSHSTLNDVLGDPSKRIDQLQLTSCLQDIERVSCGDSGMQQLQTNSRMDDFKDAGSVLGLGPSCSRVGNSVVSQSGAPFTSVP